MIEVKPNHVYTIDIDGTLCDSAAEFGRWRAYCRAGQCRHLIHITEGMLVEDGCVLGSRNRCIHEAEIVAQGIFGDEALLGFTPYPQVRGFLEAIKKEGSAKAYIVTGRSEKQRQITIDWFELHELPIFYMAMRLDGDQRIVPEIKRAAIRRLRVAYGRPGQEWVCIDDDSLLGPVCEDLGVTFHKAPECWE